MEQKPLEFERPVLFTGTGFPAVLQIKENDKRAVLECRQFTDLSRKLLEMADGIVGVVISNN